MEPTDRGEEAVLTGIAGSQANHIANVGIARATHRAAAQESETLPKVRVRERCHRTGGIIRRCVPAGAPALR
jgi:hypothetical protein